MGNKKYPVKIVNAQKELPEWTQLVGYFNMPIERNSQHDALEFCEELINYVVSVATIERKLIRYWIAGKVINLNETARSSKSKEQSILTVNPDRVTNDMVSKSTEDLYKENHFDNSMNEASISSNINVERKKRFGRKKNSCYRSVVLPILKVTV